jgi:membrane protease YdiL (CAAX protease family)
MLPPDGLQAEPPESPPVLDVVPVEAQIRRPVRPHPGFWWSFLWCFGFLIVTVLAVPLIVLLIALIIRAGLSGNAQAYFRELGTLKPDYLPPEFGLLMMPAMLAQQIVSIFLSWLIIRLIVGREWPRRLAFRPPSMTHLIFALLSLPALGALATVIVTLARQEMKRLGIPDLEDQRMLHLLAAQWPIWFSVLVVGFGPGIGEELFCRGFLGRGLVGRHGPLIGMMMTSFFFGMLHMDPALVLGTGVMGLWLHYIYLKSRSLMLPMVLHLLNNSLSMIMSAVGIDEGLPDPKGMGWWTYAGALALLVCLGWALWHTRARVVTPDGGTGWQPPYPGVEEPPAGSGSFVERPWPDWVSVLVALIGVAAFIGGHYLGMQGG